jgi:integrase
MKITYIKSIKHHSRVFFDADWSVLMMPTLWSACLNKTKKTYSKQIQDDKLSKRGKVEVMVESTLSDKSIEIYEGCVLVYLNWLNDHISQSQSLVINDNHNVPSRTIRCYLNDYLIKEKGKSEIAVKQHLAALLCYYNWLSFHDFTNSFLNLFIEPKYLSIARDNTNKRSAIKYISIPLRSVLYQNTDCLRDNLILRCGAELGLRAKENCGLLTNDFKLGKKTHFGFKSLIKDMEDNPNKMEFEYLLQGKFSKAKRGKGGESRKLYIERSLLNLFKRYIEDERPESNGNSVFLSRDGFAKPISTRTAIDVFSKVRSRVLLVQEKKNKKTDHFQALEEDHTYHVLRHSFGTDLFYNICREKNIRIDDVTTTSGPYLYVAKRLGHSTVGKNAPSTTKEYIRSCHIKESIEDLKDGIE